MNDWQTTTTTLSSLSDRRIGSRYHGPERPPAASRGATEPHARPEGQRPKKARPEAIFFARKQSGRKGPSACDRDAPHVRVPGSDSDSPYSLNLLAERPPAEVVQVAGGKARRHVRVRVPGSGEGSGGGRLVIAGRSPLRLISTSVLRRRAAFPSRHIMLAAGRGEGGVRAMVTVLAAGNPRDSDS